jgi:predicted Ser/Thr protein kinase
MIGRTLGHYKITDRLGEGGMGVVYKARDMRLDRQVAIKVLPEVFTATEERRARLEREAKLLATLSHTNIAAIFGLEEADGKPYLVLELVEGQTLAERLKKGRIPLDETLEICRQIAEGLEAAHEKGVIHRDLKPGNVMITPDDKVKILDFGLAKAFYGHAEPTDPSRSPTITDQMTAPGVILGTAAYMSPEQAKGKPTDKRADIWAFGCILFECLTGKGPFHGDTVTETLAAVIRAEPDWTAFPSDTPIKVREVLRRCLQKDANLRLRDIGDARIGIGESVAETPEPVPVTRRLPVAWLVAGAATFLLVGLLIGRFVFRHTQAASQSAVVRSVIKVAPGHGLEGWRWDPYYKFPTRTAMTMSSDGRFIVYSAVVDDPAAQNDCRLYIRRIDQMEAIPIPGTEGGFGPFLSPDNRWIGFGVWEDDGGKLRKVPIDGGVPATLCDSLLHMGASWGRDDYIVFSPFESVGLSRVSAAGGKSEALTTPDKTKEEWSHRLPHYLPDGKSLLFTITKEMFDLQPRVALLDLETRKWRVLLEDAADARYVPTGHLVFLRQGTLMAVPFDLRRLEVTGQPVPVIADVMQALNYTHNYMNTAAGQFSVSDSGWLVYSPGGIVPDWQNTLVWVDQKGNAQPAASFKAPFFAPRLSPDGQRIAYDVRGRGWQIWIYDLNRGTASKLTSEGRAAWANWTPDGKRLVFAWWRSGQGNVYWQAADGSQPMERLTTSDYWQSPGSLSPDGAILTFLEEPTSYPDILLLDLRSRRITPFLNSPASECYPEFSPDGRWLAYTSDESGRIEVYVRSFPGPGGKWLVSSEGGVEPLWARNGKQLFYRSMDGQKLWVVDIRTDGGLSPSKPHLVFEKAGYVPAGPHRGWDISLDGQRFLMVKEQEMNPQPVTEMILVQNWFKELKRLCPPGK